MKILDYLSFASVKVPLQSATKEGIVEELIGLLHDEGKIPDPDLLREAVFKREQCMSTAVGEGLAIPHAKMEGIGEPCVAIGVSFHDVGWQTPDNKPVRVVVLIISSLRDAGAQLKMLACLARYVKTPGFVDRLITAGNAQAVVELLRTFEAVIHL